MTFFGAQSSQMAFFIYHLLQLAVEVLSRWYNPLDSSLGYIAASFLVQWSLCWSDTQHGITGPPDQSSRN